MSSASSSSSRHSRSRSSSLDRIARNQDHDLKSIRRNDRNIKRNFRDIDDILGRLKDLESEVGKLTHPARQPAPKKTRPNTNRTDKGPTPTPTSTQVETKMMEMKKRSEQMQIDRAALIAFNGMNSDMSAGDRHTWQKVTPAKDGNSKTEHFDRIVDNKSLLALLSTPSVKAVVDNILVEGGGPVVNITPTVLKKYWVFLNKNQELTTLSRDFRDGVGSEYMWTDDASLEAKGCPPSSGWRNAAKHLGDPRRRHIDPRTKALWLPSTATTEKGEESSISSSSSDDSDSSSSSSSSGRVDPIP